jgi:TorA maturation chaperone TorD
LPVLAGLLPEQFDPDEAAADYQHLFGFNVFPYQSIFLDPAVLLGGQVTDEVVRSYRAAGFTLGSTAESADHIGHELQFMAFLCEAESDAWLDGLLDSAQRMKGVQVAFLERHLLRWLPPLIVAIRQQEQPFYSALADLTLDFVQAHWSSQKDEPWADLEPMAAFSLPPGPKLLDDEATGLQDIVIFLLAPAQSGLYLSRDDIGRLARKQSLPRGFGERRQMLLNLLRSAATYDGLGTLVRELQALAAGWSESYGQMTSQIPFAAAWQKRAAGTLTMIEELGQHLDRLE